ncbi:MAG: hypothetical protein U0165_15050 [Polyangiaceae bacterium]
MRSSLFVVALSVLASACSAVAGLDDLKLVDCAGASCTAGTAGAGGTAGTSGASGTSGTSGASASGGTAGTGGSSGTAGSSGSAGAGGTSGSGGTGGTAKPGCEPETRCVLAKTFCGEITVDGCDEPIVCGSCESPSYCATNETGKSCRCEGNTLSCRGAELVRCEADGTTVSTQATCSTADECELAKATGACPSCAAGSFACQGTQPVQCDVGGGSYVPVGEACSSPSVCDPTTGVCAACAKGAFYCEGTALRKCNDDGSASKLFEVCATAGLCAQSLGAGTCLPPVCGPGETRCATADGLTIEACNSDLTGFAHQHRVLCADAGVRWWRVSRRRLHIRHANVRGS